METCASRSKNPGIRIKILYGDEKLFIISASHRLPVAFNQSALLLAASSSGAKIKFLRNANVMAGVNALLFS